MAETTEQKAAAAGEKKAANAGGEFAKYKGDYNACVLDQQKKGLNPVQAAQKCAPLKAAKKEASENNAKSMNEKLRARFGR